LVAAQPAAWPVLKGMLEEVFDLVPVHTARDALRVLDAGRIDVIICTLTFSDHHMLEFLLNVKGNARTSAIPFLVCRALVGLLSEQLVESLGAVVRECGADFINIPSLPPDEAAKGLRAAVVKCLRSGKS
jgi:PleD family two-component response regulator